MSIEYDDPVIRLATDPDLNRDRRKVDELVSLMQNFPVAERKVSKLCQLSLAILQTLEKIELNLKNWAFMSLDINSADHFHTSADHIKLFNNNVATKVLTSCNELNKKLTKISYDLDYITKAQKTLSPVEFISDSGTLLTSLSLRSIKLKHELTDKVTVAYSKARLITIGTELGAMMDDDGDATVATYRSFVASLLRQLNDSIDDEDLESKHECLAVINDMDKMFDAFKLERMKAQYASDSDDDFDPIEAQSVEYDSDLATSMQTSVYSPPVVHSITRQRPELARSDSFTSLDASLHKSTLSSEMPYLMTAFNSAKNMEEDIKTYQGEEHRDDKQKHRPANLTASSRSSSSTASSPSDSHGFPSHKVNLPETPLSAQSVVLEPPHPSPYSYLYANNSLLSRLGIKPQVVSAPKELGLNTTANIRNFSPPKRLEAGKQDKENERQPLTIKNLHAHNLSSLSVNPNDIDDQVE